jgi:hypothetical protein
MIAQGYLLSTGGVTRRPSDRSPDTTAPDSPLVIERRYQDPL